MMRRTDGSDGGPAFPEHYQDSVQGLSKRDWFAGQALAGILSRYPHHSVDAAKQAYRVAEAMLEESDR